MEFKKSTNHSKSIGRISAFCPTALSIYRTFGLATLLGLMSFVMIPKKEGEISELIKDLQILKNKVIKLEQSLFRKDLIIKRKDKELARQKLRIDHPAKLVQFPKLKIQYVKEQIPLTYADSLGIARVLFDSIYAEFKPKTTPIKVFPKGK